MPVLDMKETLKWECNGVSVLHGFAARCFATSSGFVLPALAPPAYVCTVHTGMVREKRGRVGHVGHVSRLDFWAVSGQQTNASIVGGNKYKDRGTRYLAGSTSTGSSVAGF